MARCAACHGVVVVVDGIALEPGHSPGGWLVVGEDGHVWEVAAWALTDGRYRRDPDSKPLHVPHALVCPMRAGQLVLQ